MIVGVLKEIKNKENRVGLIPSFVSSLVKQDHEVLVESGAGVGSGFFDEDYLKAGAAIVNSSNEVWGKSDLIVKVKEPIQPEYEKIRPNQILFTYLHLAPNVELTDALIKTKSICIAYETVTDDFGRLPLLAPMSAIAGRMSIFIGSNLLQNQFGGNGCLPCGVPGVSPSKIVILGGGTAGLNAAIMAHGIGGDVTILDNNQMALDRIMNIFKGQVKTSYSNSNNLMNLLPEADIVIGATLTVGLSAPKLISRDMVKEMKKGSVIVDISIDQGGCCETSRATTHDDPYYDVSGVLHYCVTNMPGAYARTSTISLNNATYPMVEKIANLGYEKVLSSDKNLRNGLNIYKGNITNSAVGVSQGRGSINPDSFFK